MSRALLDKVRAAARGKDSVTELLRLAHAMAQHSRCIPQALLHFRRELCADDVFSAKGRRALILSHELTMTGAPIVLVSAVPVLRSLGFEVVVLGPSDEGSLPLFLDAGAAVVTRPDCVTSSALWGLATSADFVLANTVVEAPVVNTLNGSFVPVLWWLHDAFAGYPFISHSIPKALGKNVHLCAVGSHATAAMHSVRPDFAIEQLIYGLPDYAAEQFPRYDISFAGGRPLFVTVGSLEHRKVRTSSATPSGCCPLQCGKKPPSFLWAKPPTRGCTTPWTAWCGTIPRPFSTASGWSARRSNP